MEHIAATQTIKIKDIFLDNGNWWRFFLLYRQYLRISIIINVLKMIVCGTTFMGFKYYICALCYSIKQVCFTCKCRFCTSCGRKATENWIRNNNAKIPDTTWQHITFTMPKQFWNLFWLNRHLFNLVAPIPPKIIKEYCLKKGCIPGIFMAIHTFGRDLKRNVHFHLSSTCGGLNKPLFTWIPVFFYAEPIKKRWRYLLIKTLKEEFAKGNLKLPKNMKHIKNQSQFNAWINQFSRKKWMVFLQKQSANKKTNIDYLGRYLKRPPLAEARITQYDRKTVSFTFFDHKTKSTKTNKMPVQIFLGKLVAHIPDKHFRCIRYYGFLSNRTRSLLLPIVNNLLGNPVSSVPTTLTWQDLIKFEFNHDPLQCQRCHVQLCLAGVTFPKKATILMQYHKQLALQHVGCSDTL